MAEGGGSSGILNSGLLQAWFGPSDCRLGQNQILQECPLQVCSGDFRGSRGWGLRKAELSYDSSCKRDWLSVSDLVSLFNRGKKTDFPWSGAELQSPPTWEDCSCVPLFIRERFPECLLCALYEGGKMNPWSLLQAHGDSQYFLSSSQVSGPSLTLSHLTVTRVLGW